MTRFAAYHRQQGAKYAQAQLGGVHQATQPPTPVKVPPPMQVSSPAPVPAGPALALGDVAAQANVGRAQTSPAQLGSPLAKLSNFNRHLVPQISDDSEIRPDNGHAFLGTNFSEGTPANTRQINSAFDALKALTYKNTDLVESGGSQMAGPGI